MTAGQDRIAIEVWDFVSSDGSVIITAEEFAGVGAAVPIDQGRSKDGSGRLPRLAEASAGTQA
jgi:hypothetical protein